MVDEYLHQVLQGQLKRFHLPGTAISEVADDISAKIYSLLGYADNSRSLDGVLLTGREEGEFYEPASPISPFVVVAIRNSALESYHAKGKNQFISDAQMRMVTQQAILYWEGCNWDTIAVPGGHQDHYQALNQRYPAAWEALKVLGDMTGLATDYPSVPAAKDVLLLDRLARASEDGFDTGGFNIEVQDGYSDNLDELLLAGLFALLNGTLDLFYTVSFKMLSRNYGKLLRIIEFCMYCEKPYVTANYYISNGHVERRARLLQAAHGGAGLMHKSILVPGSRGLLRDALKLVPEFSG